MRDSDINRELMLQNSELTNLKARREDILAKIAKLEDHKKFNEHLRHASKVVAGWPEWKHQVLRKQQVLRPFTPAEKLARAESIKGLGKAQFVEHVGKANAVLELKVVEQVGDVSSTVTARGEDDALGVRIDKALAACHAEEEAKEKPKLQVYTRDISDEPERMYEWYCPITDDEIEVIIEEPASVSFHKGCTTHKVTKKDGTIIYVPAPGVFGCIVVVK